LALLGCLCHRREDGTKVVGIDHVQLAMPSGDEERAVGFYTGVLGIPEVAKPPQLARRGGCWFEQDRLRLHLGVEADSVRRRRHTPRCSLKVLPRSSTDCTRPKSRRGDEPLDGYDRVIV
jgi:hypothetical protein